MTDCFAACSHHSAVYLGGFSPSDVSLLVFKLCGTHKATSEAQREDAEIGMFPRLTPRGALACLTEASVHEALTVF